MRQRHTIDRPGIRAGMLATAIALTLAGCVPTPPAAFPSSSSAADGGTGGPANMASNGIVIEAAGPVATDANSGAEAATPTEVRDDVTQIVIYQDYFCPVCNMFHQTNAAYIDELVASGEATVEYHPVSILDSRSLGTQYSTRSANLASCVADLEPASFAAVNDALFDDQPAEGTEGLTDDELLERAAAAGVTADLTECVSSRQFGDWVLAATQLAFTEPLPNTDDVEITGTPGVIVNGEQYPGGIDDADAFQAFVEEQS